MLCKKKIKSVLSNVTEPDVLSKAGSHDESDSLGQEDDQIQSRALFRKEVNTGSLKECIPSLHEVAVFFCKIKN